METRTPRPTHYPNRITHHDRFNTPKQLIRHVHNMFRTRKGRLCVSPKPTYKILLVSNNNKSHPCVRLLTGPPSSLIFLTPYFLLYYAPSINLRLQLALNFIGSMGCNRCKLIGLVFLVFLLVELGEPPFSRRCSSSLSIRDSVRSMRSRLYFLLF